MAITIPFTLENKVPDKEAHLATLVFIENLYADIPAPPPAQETQEDENPVRFFYKTWQFLNPSSKALQAFSYIWQLSVIARIVSETKEESEKQDPPLLYEPSQRIEVFTGQRWQIETAAITRSGKTWNQLKLKSAGAAKMEDSVEIVSSIDPEPGCTLEVDWYFGPNPMGLSSGLSKGKETRVQAGKNLYFTPVIPNLEDWNKKKWVPGKLGNITAYQPPLQADKVSVFFRKPQGSKPEERRYTFAPPEAG